MHSRIHFLSNPNVTDVKYTYKDYTITNHFTNAGNDYNLEGPGTFNDVTILYFTPKQEAINNPEWFVVIRSETAAKEAFVAIGSEDYTTILTTIILTVSVSLLCFIFTIYYRNTNVIKLSQPTFLAILPLGCAGMGLSIMASLGPPTVYNCRFELLWINVFTTLTFTAFLWKIHRAWRVAKAIRYMKKIKFTNLDVYKYIFSVVALEAVLQVINMALLRKRPSTKYRCTYNDDAKECNALTEYYGCFPPDYVSDASLDISRVIQGLSYLLKASMIAFGLLLCYRTKR